MHQQVPAMWRGRDVINEEIVQAIIGAAIGQRQIQCTLDLSAQLLRLPILIFQETLPLAAHAYAHRSMQTRGLRPSTWLLLNAMGAGTAGAMLTRRAGSTTWCGVQ